MHVLELLGHREVREGRHPRGLVRDHAVRPAGPPADPRRGTGGRQDHRGRPPDRRPAALRSRRPRRRDHRHRHKNSHRITRRHLRSVPARQASHRRTPLPGLPVANAKGPAMKQRTLGQGMTVSAIGMGCMTLTEMNYGPVDENESEATLNRAIDLGINLLDTGEVYGKDHSNETFIGRIVEHRREEVYLCTKFGLIYDFRRGPMVPDSRPEVIRRSLEGSLRRLRTDYIDLYYQHRVDPNVPIEDVWGELSLLVEEGKVRHLGLSEPGISTLRKAHSIHPVTAVENEYSLFTREPEAELIPTLNELGVGLVCFAPLGRGLLSGKVRNPDDFAP